MERERSREGLLCKTNHDDEGQTQSMKRGGLENEAETEIVTLS